MRDLMELVEGCEKYQAEPCRNPEDNQAKVQELLGLGFKTAAETLEKKLTEKLKLSRIAEFGYIVVTEDKIKRYLKAKAERYDAENPRPKKKEYTAYNLPPFHWVYLGGLVSSNNMLDPEIESFEEKTAWYDDTSKDKIGKFVWNELRAAYYKAIPPAGVLSTLHEHKARNVFDYFTVASVEGVPDPLLLGRIEGRSERWFIAQWGDDVQIDDLI